MHMALLARKELFAIDFKLRIRILKKEKNIPAVFSEMIVSVATQSQQVVNVLRVLFK